MAIGALGVAGLVEWPVLLAVGGGALLLRRLNQKSEAPAKASLKPVPTEPASKKAAPQKGRREVAGQEDGGRRAGTTELRSTN